MKIIISLHRMNYAHKAHAHIQFYSQKQNRNTAFVNGKKAFFTFKFKTKFNLLH